MQIDKTGEIVTLLKKTLRSAVIVQVSAKITLSQIMPRELDRNGKSQCEINQPFQSADNYLARGQVRKYFKAIEGGGVQRD